MTRSRLWREWPRLWSRKLSHVCSSDQQKEHNKSFISKCRAVNVPLEVLWAWKHFNRETNHCQQGRYFVTKSKVIREQLPQWCTCPLARDWRATLNSLHHQSLNIKQKPLSRRHFWKGNIDLSTQKNTVKRIKILFSLFETSKWEQQNNTCSNKHL